jgi:hypothetical protein
VTAGRLAALVLVWAACGGAARAAEPAPDAGASADAAGPVAVDAAPSDAVAPAGADAGAANAPDAGVTPVAPPVPTLPFYGRVLEKGTGKPLAAAAIAIDGVAAAETDAEGRFSVAAPAGTHDLGIKVAGQEVVHQPIGLVPGVEAAEQVFRVLTRGSGARYATRVRADRPEIPKVEVTGEEARQTAGTSGDPLRVIASLPGVIQIAWPASLYVVRGANPGNTGFFLDGIRVPELFHLGLELSVINPYLIEGVEFYPGGSPANYGPYVSGIMAARTTPPPSDRAHASADVTLFDAGGIATSPWDGGRGTAVVAARYSYTGALFSALQNNTVLRYGDYQIRVDHPLAGGQATLFAFGAQDDVGFTNPGANKEYGALQFHRLDLRWRRAVAGGRLLVGATGGADWASSTLFDSTIKVRSLSAAPRLIYVHPLGRAVDLEVGANANFQTFATDVPMFQPMQSDLANARRAVSEAAYTTVTFRAGDRLIVSPGLRTDRFAEQGTSVFFVEPRLDALFHVTDALALRADGGRYAQMPSLPVSVPGFEAFGLKDYGAQTSVGGALGAEMKLRANLTLGVTGFYQLLRLTDVRNIDLEQPQAMAPDFLVSRDGRAYGAEVLLRRADTGRLYGWVAYTLSWSQRYDDNGVLGRSDWDERHILNVVAGMRVRGGYSFGGRFHLNTGRWAPVVHSPGGDYQQLPTYYQIDLRAERRFIFDRFVMDVYADIANVTDNTEVLQLDYVYAAYGAKSMVAQDVVKFTLPTIGLHAQF